MHHNPTTLASIGTASLVQQLQAIKEQRDGSFGYYYDVDANILFFSGSNEKSDWAVNLNFNPISFPYHQGYLNEANKMVEDFSHVISHNKPLLVGHSGGGAVAAYIGQLEGCHVITFGAPKTYRHKLASNPKHQIHISQKGDCIARFGKGRHHDFCEELVIPGTQHSIDSYVTACAEYLPSVFLEINTPSSISQIEPTRD